MQFPAVTLKSCCALFTQEFARVSGGGQAKDFAHAIFGRGMCAPV
jgi:hypothetical protein